MQDEKNGDRQGQSGERHQDSKGTYYGDKPEYEGEIDPNKGSGGKPGYGQGAGKGEYEEGGLDKPGYDQGSGKGDWGGEGGSKQ